MYVLRNKHTKEYVRGFSFRNRGSNLYTTNINEAKTYINLEELKDTTVYINGKWIRVLDSDFEVFELVIGIGKRIDNLKRN